MYAEALFQILQRYQAELSNKKKKVAEALQEQLENIEDFEDILLNMMDGLLKGFSCLEMEWKFEEV